MILKKLIFYNKFKLKKQPLNNTMDTIDISDLDMKTLLKELWTNTITASFYKHNPYIPAPGYSEPEKYNIYFDYHCGRPIKTNFEDMSKIWYKLYDRDAGDGKFLEIVTRLRNKQG
jgi:hypothetical protein